MIIVADAVAGLRQLEAGSARCCVTSPPYFGLRDYGAEGQIGLEDTPEQYVERLVEVFVEVRRVLADDGTLWLNLGDSYAPNKQLQGIPWRVAFALQADGWYLRSDIIWHKPNPMPESVGDRCTSSHEYVFMLSKSQRYYWDQDAVRERHLHPKLARQLGNGRDVDYQRSSGRNDGGRHVSGPGFPSDPDRGRNRRDVWSVPTHPYPGAHFAVMPPALVEPCIQAGSEIDDLVLDPFAGAATVGVVARRLRRRFVGVELNPDFAALGRRRIEDDAPMFNRPRIDP